MAGRPVRTSGALLGLVGVLLGARWADPVAGLAVTLFICHVGWEVTADVTHRLMDGVDPQLVTRAEAVAADVPGVRHAHARARWTGRFLRLEIEGWVDATTSVSAADTIGQAVAAAVARATRGPQLHLDRPRGLTHPPRSWPATRSARTRRRRR